MSEQSSLPCDGGARALSSLVSLSPFLFLHLSISLLFSGLGFDLGSGLASGLAVLTMNYLHPAGLMNIHGPACQAIFPLCQENELSRARQWESRAAECWHRSVCIFPYYKEKKARLRGEKQLIT